MIQYTFFQMAVRLNLQVLQDQLKGLEYIPEKKNRKKGMHHSKFQDGICISANQIV